MTDTDYDKPVPAPTPASQPYWDGLRAHRLLLQQCGACGRIRHYPRPICDGCYSLDVSWVESRGRGTVHSWTISHRAFHAGFKADVPYVTVTVDLDEGVRASARLKGAPAEGIRIGMEVEVDFEDVTEELTLPVFRPANASR